MSEREEAEVWSEAVSHADENGAVSAEAADQETIGQGSSRNDTPANNSPRSGAEGRGRQTAVDMRRSSPVVLTGTTSFKAEARPIPALSLSSSSVVLRKPQNPDRRAINETFSIKELNRQRRRN